MPDVTTKKALANEEDPNLDPLTGAPGAHPQGAESINLTAEEQYWRETFVRESYYERGRPWGYYAPAFRAGWEGRVRHDGRSFEEAEPALIAGYNAGKTALYPDWSAVRPAAKAAWERVDLVRKSKP
jgi:hypothetical protein